MAEYTEWCEELADALAAPFPAECVKTKTRGGANIPFVSWHHYAHRLNALVGPDGWSMDDPIVRDIGGKLVMGVPVTILGVRKINFGDEDEGKDDYGTASTNAWAQAFKRTCALFGLGLYLYDKDSRPQPRQSGGQRTQRQPARQQPARRDAGGGNGRPASEGQLRRIDKLVMERAVPDDVLARVQAHMAAGMTSTKASEIIDYLSALPVEQTAGAA
ncbi:MAG TPA: Rad52/Rad22 family DNA repair protein [Longimicrobiales bacterium]